MLSYGPGGAHHNAVKVEHHAESFVRMLQQQGGQEGKAFSFKTVCAHTGACVICRVPEEHCPCLPAAADTPCFALLHLLGTVCSAAAAAWCSCRQSDAHDGVTGPAAADDQCR